MSKSISKSRATIERQLINDMIQNMKKNDGIYNVEEIVKWLERWYPINITIQGMK